MPNLSLKRTRYGRRCQPHPRHLVHHREPGWRLLVARAVSLEREVFDPMSRPVHRLTAAAHAEISHANPLSSAQMTQLAEWATQWAPATAIDIGCGPGSFSIGLAARCPVRVRAIDPNPHFLERARREARGAALLGSIDFLERTLCEDEGGCFDVVVCLGSSGAVGSPREALLRCKRLLSRTGVLVFADLAWRCEPPRDFASFLGVDESFLWLQSDAERVFAESGLSVVHQCQASADSWESYETAVLAGRLRLADAMDSKEGEALRRRATSWFAMYEAYGRACLGFHASVARLAEA